jgi:hypothetical protein
LVGAVVQHDQQLELLRAGILNVVAIASGHVADAEFLGTDAAVVGLCTSGLS